MSYIDKYNGEKNKAGVGDKECRDGCNCKYGDQVKTQRGCNIPQRGCKIPKEQKYQLLVELHSRQWE